MTIGEITKQMIKDGSSKTPIKPLDKIIEEVAEKFGMSFHDATCLVLKMTYELF